MVAILAIVIKWCFMMFAVLVLYFATGYLASNKGFIETVDDPSFISYLKFASIVCAFVACGLNIIVSLILTGIVWAIYKMIVCVYNKMT